MFVLTKEVDHQAVELWKVPQNEPLTQKFVFDNLKKES